MWSEPDRNRICRDDAGRPVDVIDFGNGRPMIQIGDVATIDMATFERGMSELSKKIGSSS